MISSPIDEVKSRLDIVEVISSYIKLSKTGANYRALCPFHSEKKPSFFVSPARQIWHCFGCGKGGDIFGFVKEIEGVEFGDALRILAKRAGVELKPMRPELRTERQRLYEICELATRFFEKQLEESSSGKEAKKYLLSRGISEDSIKKWRLGYSPDTWEGLTEFLVSRGYKREEVIKAGLAIQKEPVGEISSQIRQDLRDAYDRFRGRIIFPIFDLNSQTVGFGGRVFKEKDKAEIAKYVNTPNTLLYDKSRVLYGLDKAKVEIRKGDNCILVEGYTDVIMSHQVGVQNVVATSGTALTPYQLKILKRYSENLILGFDMDVAGDSATKRGIDLAQMQGFNIKVIRLSEGKDAADIISKNPKEWQDSLLNQKSILEFYFESAFSGRDSKTPEGKKAIAKILLPVIKRIPNKIERGYWIQKLAKELGAKEENIEEELKKVKLDEYPEVYGLEPEEIKNLLPKSRKELLEERIVILLLVSKSPESLEFINNEEISCLSPRIQEIFKKIKGNIMEGSEFNVVGLSPELTDLFNTIYLQAEIEEIEKKDILPEIQCCLKEIQSLEVKNKLDQISKEIKQAEEEKDSKKIEKLSQEFNQLAKNINIL
jgi:DNA primase